MIKLSQRFEMLKGLQKIVPIFVVKGFWFLKFPNFSVS